MLDKTRTSSSGVMNDTENMNQMRITYMTTQNWDLAAWRPICYAVLAFQWFLFGSRHLAYSSAGSPAVVAQT